jgi:quinol monooxygenase YgiN
MSDAVVVVAHMKATEGNEDKVEQALTGLVATTHTEDGCESYGLHKDLGDPSKFTFVEKWASMDALVVHGGQPGMSIFGDLIGEGALDADIQMSILSPIEAGDPNKGL